GSVCVMEVQGELARLEFPQKKLNDFAGLPGIADPDGIAQRELVAADLAQAPRNFQRARRVHLAFVRAAPDGAEVGAHEQALLLRGRHDLAEVLQRLRHALYHVEGPDLVESDHQLLGCTFSRTHSAIDLVVAPGVKISRTPSFFSSGMSESGMIPPPKTITSSAPCFLSRSITAGNSVMCAPDMIERPIASTSSCSAAATIISGVWCRPV